MTTNMREEIIEIADKYCSFFNIARQDLFQKGKHKGGKKKKVVNGVNVATIRMALGYYLSTYYPVSLTEIAGVIGYNDHSTISTNNQKIFYYIKNQDKYFTYYYNLLLDLGSLYNPIQFLKLNKNQVGLLN